MATRPFEDPPLTPSGRVRVIASPLAITTRRMRIGTGGARLAAPAAGPCLGAQLLRDRADLGGVVTGCVSLCANSCARRAGLGCAPGRAAGQAGRIVDAAHRRACVFSRWWPGRKCKRGAALGEVGVKPLKLRLRVVGERWWRATRGWHRLLDPWLLEHATRLARRNAHEHDRHHHTLSRPRAMPSLHGHTGIIRHRSNSSRVVANVEVSRFRFDSRSLIGGYLGAHN